MRRLIVGMAALAAFGLMASTGWSEPPEGKGKGPKGPGGPKGDRAGHHFQLGKVMPPGMRERLELSEEQGKLLDDLEKDVKDRLNKILTADQKKKLEEGRGQGPGPGGPGGERRPPDGNRPKGKFKEKGEPPPAQ